MPTELPGAVVSATPSLPGVNVPPPTPEHKAELEAQVAQWNTNLRPALADLIAVLEKHPELVQWAKASEAGTLRFSQP